MAEESAFSVGDRVHIVGFFQPLKTATVKRITQVPTFDGDKRIRIFVKNSRGEEYGFWPHELEKVQGKAQAGGNSQGSSEAPVTLPDVANTLRRDAH